LVNEDWGFVGEGPNREKIKGEALADSKSTKLSLRKVGKNSRDTAQVPQSGDTKKKKKNKHKMMGQWQEETPQRSTQLDRKGKRQRQLKRKKCKTEVALTEGTAFKERSAKGSRGNDASLKIREGGAERRLGQKNWGGRRVVVSEGGKRTIHAKRGGKCERRMGGGTKQKTSRLQKTNKEWKKSSATASTEEGKGKKVI